ncbi:MAG: alkaline phosphatase [bacterium]
MQIRLGFFTVLIVGFLATGLSRAEWRPLPPRAATDQTPPEVRNVIMMIPDGCSQSMVTLARWVHGGPLAVDQIQSGAVKTHSADNLVTDSAAAATALATGVKTANGTLGAAPPQNAILRPSNLPYGAYQPLATLLEGAKQSGRSAGLVVTVGAWEATPAAFAAHAVSRSSDCDIMQQLVHQDLDVVFGGGRQQLLPADAGGVRRDGQNLIEQLQKRGVQVIGDARAMERLTSGRAWGIFSPGSLSAEIDRAARTPDQPSLAQMTAKAIDLLKQNRKGFFLMVEGSQVDWADHANDPARGVREFLAFDDAMAVALKFAAGEGQGQTLVLACPDHDTGGMTIGHRARTPRTRADLVDSMTRMQISTDLLAEKIGTNYTTATIAANVEAWWNIRLPDATAEEITNRVAKGASMSSALMETAVRPQSAIGWTSGGHTGVDVPLWSYGPGRPIGLLDNTEVAQVAARALRLNLPALTRELFVDAQKQFPAAQLDCADPTHPVLTIGTARLPVNQNVLIQNGQEQRFRGVVVHIEKTGRTYLPQAAVNLISKHPIPPADRGGPGLPAAERAE